MGSACLVRIQFRGDEAEIERIHNHIKEYVGSSDLQDLASECSIDASQINYFLNSHHKAKLVSEDNYSEILVAVFATDLLAAELIKQMMEQIKGSCRFAWYQWGNSGYCAQFFDDDYEEYLDEVLVVSTDAYNDDEDFNICDEEDDELYYELDSLESAIVNWCDYHDFEREDQSDEQMLEIIAEQNADSDFKVYAFTKEEHEPLNQKVVAKVMISGPTEIIEKVYSKADEAINDEDGDFNYFVEEYNDDDDFLGDCQLLDAKLTEEDYDYSCLELSVITFMPSTYNYDPSNSDIRELFVTLTDLITEREYFGLDMSIWQVAECSLCTCSEIDDAYHADCQIGYLSVEALEEMGVKLLMCDYLEDVVDKWCELVSYDRDDKDVDEMLEIINTYEYEHENTKIKAGLVE